VAKRRDEREREKERKNGGAIPGMPQPQPGMPQLPQIDQSIQVRLPLSSTPDFLSVFWSLRFSVSVSVSLSVSLSLSPSPCLLPLLPLSLPGGVKSNLIPPMLTFRHLAFSRVSCAQGKMVGHGAKGKDADTFGASMASTGGGMGGGGGGGMSMADKHRLMMEEVERERQAFNAEWNKNKAPAAAAPAQAQEHQDHPDVLSMLFNGQGGGEGGFGGDGGIPDNYGIGGDSADLGIPGMGLAPLMPFSGGVPPEASPGKGFAKSRAGRWFTVGDEASPSQVTFSCASVPKVFRGGGLKFWDMGGFSVAGDLVFVGRGSRVWSRCFVHFSPLVMKLLRVKGNISPDYLGSGIGSVVYHRQTRQARPWTLISTPLNCRHKCHPRWLPSGGTPVGTRPRVPSTEGVDLADFLHLDCLFLLPRLLGQRHPRPRPPLPQSTLPLSAVAPGVE
jgi:hypothetical protein